MNNQAIKDLYELVPEDKHLKLLQWEQKWLKLVEKEQIFIRQKNITAEMNDVICEKVVGQCVEQLIDDNLVKFRKEKDRYIVQMLVIEHKNEIKHEN